MKGKKFTIAALAFAIAIIALPFRTEAVLVSQMDTNSLLPATTNTLALTGDISLTYTNGQIPGTALYLDTSQSDDTFLLVSAFATNTTATSSNIIVRVAGSPDTLNWTNNLATIILTVPATSTGWCSAVTPIQNCYPFYGLRTVENTNVSVIGLRSNSTVLKAISKKGI